MQKTYAAITVDIMESRKVQQAIRPLLLDAVSAVNESFRDELSVPFAITLGDEFQGLAVDAAACPRIINAIRLELSPLKCWVGVGVGAVLSELALRTTEMEGPAFTLSRAAVDEAKRQRNRFTVYNADDKHLSDTANTVSMLIDIIQSGWTDKQWEAVRVYTEQGDLARSAAQLGITLQAVGKRLRPTHWAEIAAATGNLAELLSHLSGYHG